MQADDDDLWERQMRLAEAANLDPMTADPVPGRDHPEEPWDAEYVNRWPLEREPPHPWVSRLGLLFGFLTLPFAWLWKKIKEWTL